MKTYLKITFFFALSLIMFNVSAQSDNTRTTGWPVSKDVQRYSNKSLATHKPLKVNLRGTPASVQSKGVHVNRQETPAAGNVRSTGYPTWIISKRVNAVNN